ncbi:DnaB-like helicase C-terminal domain-containing protein [Streptomyces sp. NPDC058256]|uniref:DnaB-like helicase C-terminal domain-containing protein n=1 Tax=Streptomyces sp. NPDC058256 TaxID=3346408 RepID=UPI0036EA0028
MSVDVAGRVKSVPEVDTNRARKDWGSLIKEAMNGRSTVIVRAEDGLSVVLVPSADDPGRGEEFTSSSVREQLIHLMEQAHQGQSVVVTRHGSAVAVMRAVAAPVPLAPAVRVPRSFGQVAALQDEGPGVCFGLPSLDAVAGDLVKPGRVVLIAAAPPAPPAAGSHLVASMARAVALDAGRPVLYAASGLTSREVADRMVAADSQVPYQDVRRNAFAPAQQQAVDEARRRLATSQLYFDDGDDGARLTAAMIASTARYIDGLALVAVDRLQAAEAAHLPLSGPQLPAAVRMLGDLAGQLRVPVVVAVDTADPDTLHTLGAHAVLTVERNGETARVVVSERDFGELASVGLQPDLQRARFIELPAACRQDSTPPPSGPVVPPAEAAVPRRAPAETAPRPVAAAQTVSRSGEERATPSAPLPAQNTPAHAPAAASVPGTAPADESAGERLVRLAGANPQLKPEDFDVLKLLGERIDDHLGHVQGDVEKAATRMQGQAITDVMDLFNRSRVGGRRQHTANPPSYDFLKKERPRGVDQVWEGRHKWVNTGLLDDVLKGSPASVPVTVLDTPGAYLNAFNVWLPQGKLLHRRHDPDNLDDGFPGPNTSSGIYLTEPSPWEHTHLPNPLGSRREPGPLLLDTATVKNLIDCHRKHDLCGPPRILESWTSKGSETFLLKLRRVLNAARLAAREQEELDIVEKYIKAMYSKFSSTLGESTANRQIKRPDWMHTVRSQAFANLWLRAFKLHASGLTIVKVMGTDEIHVAGESDWRTVFEEGHQLSQMKTKGKDAYTLTPRTARRHYPQD